MRVMLLVTDLEYGGTPLRLARLACGLRRADIGVQVGCLARAGPVSEDLAEAGIRTFSCEARSRWDFTAIMRLSRIVEETKPDLIHANLTHANVAARLVGRWRGVPVIGSTATIEVERRWHRWLERRTAGMDAAHVVNSRAVARHVVDAFGVPPERVHVVPPSLDPYPEPADRAAARAALDVAEDDYVVAWVGRMDPVKRVNLIVDCAAELADKPVRFVLAGDGPERARLEERARRANVTDKVCFLGWRADVARILGAADVFLFPSLTEGMPNAVLEAMACGAAVVGSDIPVLRELSEAGQNFLVVPALHASELADAVWELCRKPELRKTYAARSAAWARENLDPAATVRRMIDVYDRVRRGRSA